MELPQQPSHAQIVAAIRIARAQQGRTWSWDARVETSAIALLDYLYRRAHGEKWAGRGGSGRFACSLEQLVRGVAPTLGWTGSPAKMMRNHRRSVQRWLDWLQRAGLAEHTPQRDGQGNWWRTIITLHEAGAELGESEAAASVRLNAWHEQERRRRRRGTRRRHGRRLRDLSALRDRSRLGRAERRRRSCARRRLLVQHQREQIRAAIVASLAGAKAHLPHPVGAKTASRGQHEDGEPLPAFLRTIARERERETIFDQQHSEQTGQARRPGQGPARINPTDPDAVPWRIAGEVARRWRSRPAEEWAPALAAVNRRTKEMLQWPKSAACPRWRLLEAWTVLAWGDLYAAAGGGQRLALWRDEHQADVRSGMPSWLASEPHRRRRELDSAILRYERCAAARPDGWPQGGIAALTHWIAAQHRTPGENPRCLAYDVRGFSRLTKRMAAEQRAGRPSKRRRGDGPPSQQGPAVDSPPFQFRTPADDPHRRRLRRTFIDPPSTRRLTPR